jgi:hypothetical protein
MHDPDHSRVETALDQPDLVADPPAAPADKRRKPLSPAAERALAEAADRRAEIDRKTSERPTERNGRGGLEPARYGDWEVKGIASDF